MRAHAFLILVLGASAAVLAAQEPDPPGRPPGGFPFGEGFPEEEDEPEKPAAASDDSTAAYRKAVELQRGGKWAAAQKALRKVLDEHPASVHKREIEYRSDDNAFLGCDLLHESGPPERRIDVSVMGDGFTIDSPDQLLQEKWAKLCLTVLFSEDSFETYRDYFNYYFVRLASLEEGVDPNLSPEEKAKIIERNKRKTRKKKIDFSTALDCKAAGPQGQVRADPSLVRKWLNFAAKEQAGCKDDGLVIAFARFGVLGMGGGGIANVGRPDKSVTVHEFGHAFVGLLDEYANNPMEPFGDISAPNAATTSDPLKVPWAHFLKKKVQGIGVFEGGATYKKGVWRPANGCAMNSAGNTGYCAVCREASVLRIYACVSPIDGCAPAPDREYHFTEGSADALSVVPMQPRGHNLVVSWLAEPLPVNSQGPSPVPAETPAESGGSDGFERFRRMREAFGGRFLGGGRGREDRSAYDVPASGSPVTGASTRKDKDKRTVHEFQPGRLKPGRYRITAQVKDPTPWVLKDEKHLLEERRAWWITIDPRK